MKHLVNTFTICFFAFFLAVSSQETCSDFIESVWNQKAAPNPINQEQRWYFDYSGRTGKLDLGQRTDCEDTEGMKYYVLAKISPLPKSKTGAFFQKETAVCIPSFCSKSMLLADHSLLQKLFEANNWEVETDDKLTVYDIHEAPPRGAGFYLLMIFIAFLGAFAIFSTVIIYQRKKKPQNEQPRIVAIVEKKLWLIKAFDLYENGKSLYKTAGELGQNEQISTFGILRFFASAWVIFYHTWLLNAYKDYKTPTDLEFENFLKFGLLAVEYFFFIGGFLAGYVLTGKAFREGTGVRRYFSDLLHRWVRVWPPLFFSIVIYWCGVVCMTNGPLWGRFIGNVKVCDEKWWQKLLMIDNYLDQPGDYCASYTWYIDVDFQIYLAVIFVIYLYVKKRSRGYWVTFGLIIFSIIYGIVFYSIALKNGYATFDFWYVNAPARAFEVLIGVMFGFQYYEYTKHKPQKNFFALCEKQMELRYLLIIFGFYLNYLAVLEKVVIVEEIPIEYWETIRRVIMCLGTAFIFLPLANGSLSFIRTLMNLRIFQILGKLSFGAYLFHWPIILGLLYTQHQVSTTYSQARIVLRAFEVGLIVFTISIPFHLLVEKPVISIESHFLRKPKPKASNTKVHHKQDTEQADQQEAQKECKESPMIEMNREQETLIDHHPVIEFPQAITQIPSSEIKEAQKELVQHNKDQLPINKRIEATDPSDPPSADSSNQDPKQ